MGNCLTISYTCLLCVPGRLISSSVLCPLVVGLNVGSANVFFTHGEYGFSSVGSRCYSRKMI